MPYKYDEPNKVLREMPTMERPYPGNIPPQTREGQQELQLAFARYNRHIANLKSYPLTSPIKGLKDGEVAEENVHFKVAYRIWFCGIKGERESEFMYSTKEFMDTHYPNDYETVAIPLTKEEPLPMEEETQDGLWEELMLLIISPMQLGEIQKKFHITRK